MSLLGLGEPTLPPVRAKPPQFQVNVNQAQAPEWFGQLHQSPFFTDTLSQFIHGPVNIGFQDMGRGVAGRIPDPYHKPRDIELNRRRPFRGEDPTKRDERATRTMAHEMFHSGSLVRSLNIPDEIQQQALKAYWDNKDGLREAAKKAGITEEEFTTPDATSVMDLSGFPRIVVKDREEALAYAFGEAVANLRAGKELTAEEADNPGADIFLDYLRGLLDTKESKDATPQNQRNP